LQLIAVTRGEKVSSITVKKGDLFDYYTEEGVLNAGVEYQVFSKVTGAIDSVAVSENMEVKKGDLLFVISDRDLSYEKEIHQSALLRYQAQLEQSNINQIMSTSPDEYLASIKQDLTVSQARYQAAKNLADAKSALYQSGSVSKMELEQAQVEYSSAQSSYNAAKKRYEESQQFLKNLNDEGINKDALNERFYKSISGQLQAQIQSEETTISKLEDQIGDCKIVAECDGVIKTLPGKERSMIQSGQVVAIINSKQEPIIEADVLTSIEPYLTEGAPVVLTQKLRNQDYHYSGTISEIYDFASKGTSALGLDEYRVHVKIKIDPEQEIPLKSGYAFNVQFTLYEGSDQLVVPLNTLFDFENQNYVFVIVNGRAEKKSVTVKYRSSAQAIISDGLQEGDKIITNVDSEKIYDGIKVNNSKE
jgi:HlyD family secretion protein